MKSSNLPLQVIGHILFWVIYYFILIEAHVTQASAYGAKCYAGVLCLTSMTVSYVNFFLFIPRLFRTENRMVFVFSNVLSLSTIVAFLYTFLYEGSKHIPIHLPLFGHAMMVGAVSIPRFLSKWKENIEQKSLLRNQKIEAELNFLKTQLNPHFLFNSLNNLYALIITKDERASTLVEKLSSILRYIIYESRIDFIDIQKEIQMIENYIEMELIKVDTKTNVSRDIYIANNQYKIAPLILLHFIENAFKHSDIKSNPEGYIHFKCHLNSQGVLLLVCSNSFKTANNSTKQSKYNGVGLGNIKKQLELCYPQKHHLDESINGNEYKISLEITLHE